MVQIRGNSNRIDRMPRKITLNPVRNLPSPHSPPLYFSSLWLFVLPLGSPDFPPSSPRPPSFLCRELFGFLSLLLFSRLFSKVSGAPFTCRSPHSGLDATLPTIFASFCTSFLHTPAPFLEWARKAAKNRCLTHLPWVGSVPVGKFDAASF